MNLTIKIAHTNCSASDLLQLSDVTWWVLIIIFVCLQLLLSLFFFSFYMSILVDMNQEHEHLLYLTMTSSDEIHDGMNLELYYQ